MAHQAQSIYQPVITPVDVYTQHSVLPNNHQNNVEGPKSPLGTIKVSNALLERMNIFGQAYFFVLTFSLYFTIVYHSDSVYASNSTYINYFITYVLANICGNYFLCMKYGAFYKPVELKELPDENWSFCSYCQQKQPPRCHHCPLCHKCISKRDHHCFFIATCIGERNQGYFTAYCFYVCIGFYFGFEVISHFLSNTYYELFSLDFYHYIPPYTLYELIRGRIDILTFLMVLLMAGSLVTGFFTALLFLWQCILITCDLTTHDAQTAWSKGAVMWSKLRPWYNIKAVFGPIPILAFLFPIPMLSSKTIYSVRSSKLFL